MKKYNDGTVTRRVAVIGKPNEYQHLEYLAIGAGTAVYKSNEYDYVRSNDIKLIYFLKLNTMEWWQL